MNFVRIDDVALHVRRLPVPGKPSLVFVNSLGTDFRIWDDLVRQFAPDFAIVTYDKRGHGLSELGQAAQTIETHAADLAGLLDHFGIRRATICGLSIGGLIAQGLYLQRPDLIERLVLCDTAARIGTTELWNSRIDATVSDGIESFADEVMRKWFTPDFHRLRAAELAGARAMLTRQSPAGYAAACAAIRDADYTSVAHKIEVATLCVVGDQDGSTPPDIVAGLARSIPGSRFEIIAGAGHIPCVERPDELARLIRGFIADTGRTQTGETAGGPMHTRGMATRRAVLGDAHVDRAQAAMTAFDTPFQNLITEAAWGHVWSRPSLSRRERSMITIALLAALGQDDEVAMHVRATANTGASRDDIGEALLHVAIYAGVPAANHAIKIARKAFQDMDATAGTS